MLADFIILSQQIQSQEFSVKVRIVLNRNGLVELDQALLLESHLEEKLIPVSFFSDQEQIFFLGKQKTASR